MEERLGIPETARREDVANNEAAASNPGVEEEELQQ